MFFKPIDYAMKKLFIICFTLLLITQAYAQTSENSVALTQNEIRMQWWKDAKFGMFIHWGIYSVPSGKWGDKTTYGEWIMHSAKISRAEYSALAKQFNPTGFRRYQRIFLKPVSRLSFRIWDSKSAKNANRLACS